MSICRDEEYLGELGGGLGGGGAQEGPRAGVLHGR